MDLGELQLYEYKQLVQLIETTSATAYMQSITAVSMKIIPGVDV